MNRNQISKRKKFELTFPISFIERMNLCNAMNELFEINEMKGRFFAIISHSLKNS